MIPSREESDEACRMCFREEDPDEPSVDSERAVPTEQKPEEQNQTSEATGTQSSEKLSTSDQPQSEDQASVSDPATSKERSVNAGSPEPNRSDDDQSAAVQNAAAVENGGDSEVKEAGDRHELDAPAEADRQRQKKTESSGEAMHADVKDSRTLKTLRRMKTLTVVSLAFSAVLLLILAGMIPNPLSGVLNTSVNVIVLAKDVSKGEAIQEDDLTSALMPADQLERISAPDTVDRGCFRIRHFRERSTLEQQELRHRKVCVCRASCRRCPSFVRLCSFEEQHDDDGTECGWEDGVYPCICS